MAKQTMRLHNELIILINTSININFRIMNKKISTLFAAAMLASAFAVNAGVYVGDAVSKLAIGNNEKLYQLQLNSVGSTTETTERVLALDEDGKILIEDAQTVTLGTSLWCVNVHDRLAGF